MSKSVDHFDLDSSAVVAGLASGLLSYCHKQSAAFLRCKAKHENPEKCISEAIEARKCAFTLANEYLNPKYGCAGKFTKYVQCLRDNEFSFRYCYEPRLDFETCAHENIGVEFRDPVNPEVGN